MPTDSARRPPRQIDEDHRLDGGRRLLPAVIRAPDGVLDLSNDDTVAHSFLVLGLAKGTELQPGGSITLDLSGSPSGTYEVICDIPGHREAGMVATLQLGEACVGEPDP